MVNVRSIAIALTMVAILLTSAYLTRLITQPSPHVYTVTSTTPAPLVQYYVNQPSLLNNTQLTSLIKAIAKTNLAPVIEGAITGEAGNTLLSLLELRQYNESMTKAFLNGNLTGARLIALNGVNEASSIYNSLIPLLAKLISILPPEYGQYIESYNKSLVDYLIRLNESFLRVLNTNYTGTRIIIHVNATNVVPGEGLVVTGRLINALGEPIVNASIAVMINDTLINVTKTSLGGWFNLTISSLRVYGHVVDLTAVFNSSIYSTYLPARGIVNITVNTLNSTIIAEAKPTLWGSPIIIMGFVNGSGRVVSIKAGSIRINTTTDELGFFNASIPTSPLRPGVVNITLYAEPKGPYAPVSLSINATIIALSPSVKVKAPTLVTGMPTGIAVELTPLNATGVNVTLVTPSGNESFILSRSHEVIPVKLPLTLGSGVYKFTIVAGGRPPYAQSILYFNALVINPIQLTAPLILALTILLMYNRRSISGPSEHGVNEVKVPVSGVEVKQLPLLIPYDSSRLNDPNVRIIVTQFSKALRHIINKTGNAPNPSETPREYLSRVRGLLSSGEYLTVSELLGIYEEAVYSSRVISQGVVKRVEELLRGLINHED
ncbi:DUF4129 domain-containing protein [Caldivirga maquilingensis]|uniref:Protein-glutamine gamma-glutamyltransferase-like C-terminal domain-containing protein n=1 Tax=Caldivirga maquilingensis (strain ATCC 700844 / DSM 13496 / JCM 10307 / IC-167) TaxID=397948 RepID=A8M936_CALMQ|nr:DUF4129 domain-containing protein [Caldivirga maquilingensis]ABW02255.1 hypothetical protein Cmaq_1430 [Caldivirga maquilingensis IC-167]